MIRSTLSLLRSFVPDSIREFLGVMGVSITLIYVGYSIFFQSPPSTIIYHEEPYNREVAQGEYLAWSVDLEFDRSCTIVARRIITGSDGVEYLAVEDSKEVIAGERTQYDVRIPVDTSLPLGPARVQSRVEYRCDFWSRYINPIRSIGRERPFTIMPQLKVDPASAACILPIPRPGWIQVKAHLRRVPLANSR